jgi:integrase
MSSAKLTPLVIKGLKPRATRFECHDRGCPGLYVVVFPSGKRSFVVRYRYFGASRKLSLGPCLLDTGEPAIAPAIGTPLSLAAARELAAGTLRKVKAGLDPSAEKQQARQAERAVNANSLRTVCDTFLELTQIESPLRTIGQRKADLDLICQSLGRQPVDSISREQIVHQLDTISRERGPVRSDRVLKALKRLLSWYAGRRSGYQSVATSIEARTSATERARTRVLTDAELRQIWLCAEGYKHKQFGAYLQFLLLTATRRGEAAGLCRSELHDDGANWVIPAARYKTGHDTLVPLSGLAREIVAAQPPGEYPFGFRGAHALTSSAQRKLDFEEVCGVTGWTLHDLRRTARTLMSRAGVSSDHAERCLGHVIGGVRRHYDCHEYEPEKRAAFEALAAQIDRIVHPPEAVVADLAAARKRRQ